MATTKETLAKGLVRLFRDNMWKLHRLLESIVSDRRPQFVAEMMELNSVLEIETKLSTSFHPQTDGQIEQMNQELEQFFIDHRQKDWPEQLVLTEFVINNKTHLITKVSLFIANYGRELRIGIDFRRKDKIEKAIEFAERKKKIQKEAGAVLKKVQEEIKRQVGDRVMLSTKDLVFKEKSTKKLVNQYIALYTIEEVIFTNAVKL